MVKFERFGVAVAIEKDDRYLLLKRSDSGSLPGMWEFPGGKSELGESYLQAAVRETKEETNLDVGNLERVSEYDRMMTDRDRMVHVILLYAKEFSGDIRLSGEHSAYGWYSEEEIRGLQKIKVDVLKFFEISGRQ